MLIALPLCPARPYILNMTNATILSRIEAIYAEIDLGRDNGGKRYTRADIRAMRAEIAQLRTTLR